MSLVETILSQPGNLQRIDQIVRQLPGVRRHRGWVLVDVENFDDHAWVHARPYLMDEASATPGLRWERRNGDGLPGQEILGWLEPRSGYALALATRSRNGGLPEAALDLLQRIQEIRLPFVVLELGMEPMRLLYLDGEGRRRPLPPSGALQGDVLHLRLLGRRPLEGEWCLPISLAASSPAPRALLEVQLPEDRAGFQRNRYVFLLENPRGQALGAGCVRLDVRPEPEGRDELVLAAEGFPEPPRILTFADLPRSGPRPGKDERWRLHLLFDRTTLDVDAWPAAVASGYRPAGSRGEASGEDRTDILTQQPAAVGASPDISLWNRQLRQNLAAALCELDAAVPALEFDLWWFADVPREGIERHPTIEPLRMAYSPCGKCSREHLVEVFAGDQFGYHPGLDVYDAVDEALEGVVRAMRAEARPIRQAVIIVGDSPPPPSDSTDPLWDLPGRPVISNARRSPRFREALEDLADLQVPVGWLFVRSPRGPAITEDSHLRPFRQGYPTFQALKQRILNLLVGIPGMTLVETSNEGDLNEPLQRLFALLRSREGGIAGMDISLDAGGAR